MNITPVSSGGSYLPTPTTRMGPPAGVSGDVAANLLAARPGLRRAAGEAAEFLEAGPAGQDRPGDDGAGSTFDTYA